MIFGRAGSGDKRGGCTCDVIAPTIVNKNAKIISLMFDSHVVDFFTYHTPIDTSSRHAACSIGESKH